MKILFIRHGDPDYSRDSLTEKGWREACLLADWMENIPVDAFYSSPLGRARDTASLTLGKKPGQTMEIREWMQEFFCPVLDPETGERRIPWDFMPRYWTRQPELYDKDRWTQHPIMRTGNVEDAFRCVREGLDALLAEHGYIRDGNFYRTEHGSEETLVFFCHMGVMMVMIGYLLGISPLVMIQGNFAAPSSVTTLVTEERIPGEAAFRCIGMGSTTHLVLGNEPFSRSGLFSEAGGDPERK